MTSLGRALLATQDCIAEQVAPEPAGTYFPRAPCPV